MEKRYYVITGVNRGLGRGLVEKLSSNSDARIIGAVRKISKAKDLKFPNLTLMECEMGSEKSRKAFISKVMKKFPQVDILVNNAGVFWDAKDGAEMNALKAKLKTLREVFEINTVAAFHLIQGFLPGMIKNNYGRIVNVSSGMGQLYDMGAGYPSYRISKAALNATTRIFAAQCKGKDVLINSVCPGWVRTDMGGKNAERSIDEGVASIMAAIELPERAKSGRFLRDGVELDW